MDIKEFVEEKFISGGWVRYNKTIARELGSEAAITLGNIIDKNVYWQGRGHKEFFHTRDHFEHETGLTPHQQRKGEDKLIDANLISIERRNHPTKVQRVNWYFLDYDAIYNYLLENHKPLSIDSSTSTDSTYIGQGFQPIDADGFDGNKNILNKNKLNKNINNIPSIASSDEPSCNDKVFNLDSLKMDALENKSTALEIELPALEFEDEYDPDALYLVEAPAKHDNINAFLFQYAAIRDRKGLPIANLNSHYDNLACVPDYVLVTYLASDGHLMNKFYDYCDDREYGTQVRHYECNSDRSPSVMVNESVFRRFMDWVEKQ